MSDNLPQRLAATGGNPPSRFTRAGKLERTTMQQANEIAADTYLNILAAESRGAVSQEVVKQAFELEATLLTGVGHLGAHATAAAIAGGALADRLLAETIGGSRARLEAITTRESNKLR